MIRLSRSTNDVDQYACVVMGEFMVSYIIFWSFSLS